MMRHGPIPKPGLLPNVNRVDKCPDYDVSFCVLYLRETDFLVLPSICKTFRRSNDKNMSIPPCLFKRMHQSEPL